MKRALWTLICLFFAANAESSVCRPCPDGTQELALHITSTDFQRLFFSKIGAPMTHAKVRKKLERSLGYRLVTMDVGVSDMTEFRQALLEVAQTCYKVRLLSTASHGEPGRLLIEDEAYDIKDVHQATQGLDCIMTPNAKIYITACNTGRACEGQRFMSMLAGNLLTRGGQVRASMNYEISVFSPYFPVSGDEQILSFDASGYSTWSRPLNCGQ